MARFNSFTSERLLEGALDALTVMAPTPRISKSCAYRAHSRCRWCSRPWPKAKKYDALIALGCVIRGETPHFEYVAGECAKGVSQVSMQYNLPIGFGVLTVDTIEQAIERAGAKAGNKDADAALTVIEMVNLLKKLRVCSEDAVKKGSRHKARQAAVALALYQWAIDPAGAGANREPLYSRSRNGDVDVEYFHHLVAKSTRHLHELDDHIPPHLDRDMAEVDPVERAILRLGAYEFEFQTEIPYKVILNEAVELAKTFGGEHGHKYVNAVLDKVATALRAREISAGPPRLEEFHNY